MKKLTRLIAIVCSIFMLGSLVACGNGGKEGDQTKTVLYVSNYNAGFGSNFLSLLEKRFEEANKDYYNPKNGKTGVDVFPRNSATAVGDSVVTGVPSSDNAIYMTSDVYYYNLISQGAALNITDIVTSNNTDGKTIESKMTQDQKNYYGYKNPSTNKTEYYAIPHYANFCGLIYNKTVFNDNSFYFAGDANNNYRAYLGSNNKYVMTNAEGTLSAGPDGKRGTADDGLPETYEQFFYMCDLMVQRGVIPFTWSANYGYEYINFLLQGLYMNYEGLANTKLNFSLDGTATNLVKLSNGVPIIDGNGNPELESDVITPETGYKLYRTAGRYYAYDFVETMFSNVSYYSGTITTGGTDHYAAQSEFLNSAKIGDNPVAMLLEGCWWENEASDYGTYRRLKIEKDTFDFGFMPLPKPTESQVGTEENPSKFIISDNGTNVMFIASNVDDEVLEIAKKFIAFANTDESLQEFTIATNTLKALNYSLSSNQQKQLSKFGQDFYNLAKSDTTEILYQGGQNNVFIRSPESFILGKSMNANDLAYNNFKEKTLDAGDYFKQFVSIHTESAWRNKYFS